MVKDASEANFLGGLLELICTKTIKSHVLADSCWREALVLEWPGLKIEQKAASPFNCDL